jgi:hypothetical protein
LDIFRLTPDTAGRVAFHAIDPKLRRELNLVPASGNSASDEHLVVSRAVYVRRVNERHAKIEGTMNGVDRGIPVGLAVELAHSHAAQTLS